MARYRTYKPELFADEKLNELPVEARFLFLGLLPFVDDMGRRPYHPQRIKLEVFPADDRITAKVVDGWMRALDRVGVIRIYTVDGKTYIWVPNFLIHQKIDRPSHTALPPHPRDRFPDCQCIACQIKRGDANAPAHYRSNSPNSNEKKRDQRRHAIGENVPGFTRRVFHDDSTTPGTVVDTSICSVGNVGSVDKPINQNLNQSQISEPSFLPSDSPPSSKAEHRRTQQAALEEIVLRMVRLLEIKHNSELLQAVASAITMKSRSKSISVEAAAQQIAARAAFVAAESPPENWEQWFRDVGYEYVPQGDPRLKDRHVYARPVCGGSLCQEGWETVKVGGLPVLRRCPDCERVWRDTSSD